MDEKPQHKQQPVDQDEPRHTTIDRLVNKRDGALFQGWGPRL